MGVGNVRRTVAGAVMVLISAMQASAASAAHARIENVRMSTEACVFDMSPLGSTPPPRWNALTFDDSAWDHATSYRRDPRSCPSNYWPNPYRSYWGANVTGAYLFRQTFTIPKAANYYGSTIWYGGGHSPTSPSTDTPWSPTRRAMAPVCTSLSPATSARGVTS